MLKMQRAVILFWFVFFAGQPFILRAQQLDRRSRKEPDIFLNTGGRTGTLDVLTFTDDFGDGSDLLATGEDKLVRVWHLKAEGLSREAQPLRWSSWREQRGSIFALALSPGKEKQRRIAIGGFGLRTGTVAILDRRTGQVVRSLIDVKTNSQPIFSVAFSPSGNRVAFGTVDGTVWLWNLADKNKDDNRFVGGPDKGTGAGREQNVVWLTRFLDEDTLVTAAEDGRVLQWDLTRDRSAPNELFHLGEIGERWYRIIVSPDGHWLLAGLSGPAVELRSFPDGKKVKRISLATGEFPRSVAFDPAGMRLAVGVNRASAKPFFNQPDGAVRIYDYGGDGKPELVGKPLPITYKVDGVAFTPDGKRLAAAGGDNHEVTLWDFKAWKQEIRGVGSCLWGVTLSEDGRYLGFCEKREPEPATTNRRAKLPMADHWRVFDLEKRQYATIADLKNPAEVLEKSEEGWTVEPNRNNKYQWFVNGPEGQHLLLPLTRLQDQVPLCYSFLKAGKDRSVRLLVGHLWGVSLFEIPPGGKPFRKRLYTGHQGEVMSLAVSKDQKWFVTAARDLTVAAWKLDDWEYQPELGASFREAGGQIVVDKLQFGSPAWEAGLLEGDLVASFFFNRDQLVYNPPKTNVTTRACLERLRNPEPGKEFAFYVVRAKRKERIPILTTVRQRPLWRFFPAGNEWILWMWKGNYYDTSTNGDSFLGWQLNSKDLESTPAFYKAEQFRKVFNRPEVLDKLMETRDLEQALKVALGDNPVPLDFEGIEPPPVQIRGAPDKVKTESFTVELVVSPRDDDPDHQPQAVNVWINDYLFKHLDAGGKPMRQKLEIPNNMLRSGANELTLQSYNKIKLGKGEVLAGRAEKTVTVICDRGAASKRLFGMAVGVNDYSASKLDSKGQKGRAFGDLKEASADAEVIRASLLKQKLFSSVDIKLQIQDERNKDVSRSKLRASLADLAKPGAVAPDDLVVLFLSGHGHYLTEAGQKDPSYWVFCCPEFDLSNPRDTGLTSLELYEALAAIPARKFVVLDTCHSGITTGNPIRGLTPNGKGPTIMAACDANEFAYEDRKLGHGLFTESILEALGDKFDVADANKDGKLNAAELFGYVEKRMPELLKGIKVPGNKQNPTVFPSKEELDPFPLAQK